MVRFHERQRFTQWWLWALLAAAVLPGLLSLPVAAGLAAVLWALVPTLLGPVLVLAFRLDVTVDEGALRLRFFPLHLSERVFPLDTIREAKTVTYAPLRDFRGWGLRTDGERWAYTVSGTRGVEITFTDGRRILVGSQRPEELAAALARG